MYKKKRHAFLSVKLLQLLLIGIAGVPLDSYPLEHEIAKESLVVKIFTNRKDGAVGVVAMPARGGSQIFVSTNDDTGELDAIVKRTTGQLKISIYGGEIEFQFSSTVSLLASGRVELQVRFENPYPCHSRIAAAPSSNTIHAAKCLHFWDHLVPSRVLVVTVIVGETNISTIINVNGQTEVFYQPVHADEINQIRRQALGMEFITAVLSANPPVSVRGINLAHALDQFFTFSRIPPEEERSFDESESGVTYSYPLHVGSPPTRFDGERPIYTRYSITRSGAFIFGTDRIQVHRIAAVDEMPELTTVHIHHPAYLISLLTGNTPTLAEVAERTHFLNHSGIRAFPGVYELLVRVSLLEVGELSLPIPSSSMPVAPVTTDQTVAAVSSGTGTVLSGPDVPLTTLMSIASGGPDIRGAYEVDFGVSLYSELMRRRSASRLPVFENMFSQTKAIIPVAHGGSPMPPIIPVPVGAAGAGGINQPPLGADYGGWGVFGSKDEEEKKKRNYHQW